MEKQKDAGGSKKQQAKTLYKEADLMLLFKLRRIAEYQTPLMQEWLGAETPCLDVFEQHLFDKKLEEAKRTIN